jgi:hypothetical protein
MNESHEHGTIATLIPSMQASENIQMWCKRNQIPCIDAGDLHCTVLFSRKPVIHLGRLNEAKLLVPAKVIGWKKLGTALTLELYAPKIKRLHEWMLKQGGTHDYPEFIAHTTVTYDWPHDHVPDSCPTMMLEFTRLVVNGIDPKFAEKATAS